jgi:glyoxylase-like metal-dependent hydrolase (beta-lactamase superfamily II)
VDDPEPPTDPVAAAAEAGIHRLSIPTPFAVGDVNAYLIEDSPLTLVDGGPDSDDAFEELERGIAELGHSIEDLELLVLTHHHLDHTGLAPRLVSLSGAEVAAVEQAVPFLESAPTVAEEDAEYVHDLMVRHGIPEESEAVLATASGAMRSWAVPVGVTRPLPDGGELHLRDRTLAVHHRPGHSPADTVLHDAGHRILIAGDHLLGHISSNAIITRRRSGRPGRPRALARYLVSLAATRELDVDLVLPGHGDPITGHRTLIDGRFAAHRRRAEKIHRMIAEQPRTAHDIARIMWGRTAESQAFLTLSEVLGHLDLLIEEGRAREVDTRGRSVFEAIEDRGGADARVPSARR